MLTIEEISNKKIWEIFLSDSQVINYPLFQSWNWGEVQKGLGNTIWRFGIFDKKKLVGICQVTDVNARRGHYFHLRHGPVLNPFTPESLDAILSYIKKLAQKNGASFIRLSPIIEKNNVDTDYIRMLGMKDAPLHKMDGELCWVLDITKSEEDILRSMRKSHRYLIRKALSDTSLKVIKTNLSKDIEKFIPLYTQLSQRKNFIPHRGVREEFEVFKKDDQALLILIEYNGTIIAGGLFDFVGKMAIYRHSASNEEYKNIPAMYLLLWEAIREAKKRYIPLFNFWGVISDSDSQKHPWHGLSHFKKGFGGEQREFLHAQDIPLSLMYWKTFGIEYISKFLKGY